MKRQALTFSLLPLMLVSACAEPVMVPPVGASEASLTCDQLLQEMESARQAGRDARADDRAKASYLLIVPAYVSWYRMDEAEEAARLRHTQLQRMYAERGCPPLTSLPGPATVPAP